MGEGGMKGEVRGGRWMGRKKSLVEKKLNNGETEGNFHAPAVGDSVHVDELNAIRPHETSF